ncbi:HypC/HybG/HupF family hydrogenase formation chaperone [Myxococcota bacterium]|nr:HypC/HybG/HupF family hydrogenase formation chaperone [Myxococcota bacterium]
MCLGIPGQIIQVTDTARKLGIVEIGGVRRTINLACIVDQDHAIGTCVGAWVLVHVGFAMNRIDPQEAQRTLDLLREMGDLQKEIASIEPTDTKTSEGTGEIR